MSSAVEGDEAPQIDVLETTQELEKARMSPPNFSAPASPSVNHALPCEMCQNYETNLTIMQDNERRLNEEIKAIKGLSNRYESDLSNEREYRQELERKMNELAVDNKDAAKDAVKQKSDLEKLLGGLLSKHEEFVKLTNEKFVEFQTKKEAAEQEYKELAEKYTKLLGTNRTTAEEMRAEPIEFPDDVGQLQFMCLQMKEDVIELKSAKQHIEMELRDDNALLREQLYEERRAREGLERDLLGQVNELQTQLGIANSQLTTAGSAVQMGEAHKRQIRDLQHTVAELEAQVAQVQNERAAVEITAQNYKARCSSLQMELDNSEHVQKDFVKLSQSLQIQLEKIRQSEQEVRWQWEDEIENCSSCSTSLAKLKPKPRCLHCGKGFCVNCVKQTVPSGNNRRPAPVCQVCHTLLNRDSKPFFAHDPPM